ncbi:MAG: cardiolipin synthase [Planctomycetota bacterium]|jgi:cardiolipin synthase
MEPRWMVITGVIVHFALQAALIVQAILRPHRDPSSRIAWIVVLVTTPVVGIIAYLLLGSVSIGRSRIARVQEVLELLPTPRDIPGMSVKEIQPLGNSRFDHIFRVGYSINGFEPIAGNSAELLADSCAAIDAMVRDIDAAKNHVHLNFYIWLTDTSGTKMAQAVCRAAKRGVVCRVMADGLGSRGIIHSPLWQAMQESGAKMAVALPIGKTPLAPLWTRVDLRNHRKILIVDNRVTYCGSQNCADPEFRVKPKYAPWIDAMVRFEGPIARQNQILFASDWMAHVDEDLKGLIMEPWTEHRRGFVAQVVGTGPTIRYSAMPEVFESLMYSARDELIITTPYYVPDEPMQAALCASGRRGVKTTLIVPKKNDSWFVAAASHSYYAALLDAGVRIFEYEGGLLHTKSLTIDEQMGLIGSANLDRRSFELNYENNILFHDEGLTRQLRERQLTYQWQSHEVTKAHVAAWSVSRRFFNNAIAMLGPVL